MITVFNRCTLMTDTNSGPLVTAGDILRAAGISSEMRSVRNHGRLERAGDAAAHARYNLPAGMASVDVGFSYFLYVRRKDYARAKTLLKI